MSYGEFNTSQGDGGEARFSVALGLYTVFVRYCSAGRRARPRMRALRRAALAIRARSQSEMSTGATELASIRVKKGVIPDSVRTSISFTFIDSFTRLERRVAEQHSRAR